MARVQLPPVQSKSGRYVEGQRITSVTDTNGNAWPCYTTRTGSTPVDFNTLTSGPEGEFQAYASPNTVIINYENDLHDNPKTIELVSGEDIEGMLTEDDIPGFPAGGIFSPIDYGGDPTGLTDSTAALQAAIDAADAVNGTVHLGAGTNIWAFSSTLTMASQIRVTSYGRGMGVNAGARLKFTGSGSNAAISFLDKVRWEFDHITCIWTNPLFTGPYINVAHAAVDPTSWSIHNCDFDADLTSGNGNEAKCYIRCHKAITGVIDQCHFDKAKTHIMMGDPDNTNSYCNAVHVRNCSFNDCDVLNPDFGQIVIGARDMQACSIRGCTFSGGGSSGYVAIRGTNSTTSASGQSGGDASSCNIYSLTIGENYFGDGGGSPPPDATIGGLNTQTDGPVLVTNNFFGNDHVRAVQAGQNQGGFVFVANKAINAPLYGTWDGTSGGVVSAIGNELSEGLCLAGEEPTHLINFEPNRNVMGGKLGITHDADFDDDIADWRAEECLVIGGKMPNTIANIGARAAVYNRTASAANDNLGLQAGQADNLSQVQMIAGTAPTVKVAANGVGVAFNGATPAARPDYTVTNRTGDRTYDCNLTTTDELADVLGTLIQDLTDMGLLQ
jgi:hypothetical protein